MKKRKQYAKWIYAARAGLVVALLMSVNAYLLLRNKIEAADILFSLASGFAWFLIEASRMYRIHLTPSLSGDVKHGVYTMILPKML